MWTQDPDLSLQDPEKVKPTGICPNDTFYSSNYKIWITSGFLHTGEERLVPKFEDSFTFPSGTSSVVYDSNYCLNFPDSTKQCAQFCNPRTSVPELNPYLLNRYDKGLKRDPAEDALSDFFIRGKPCILQQQQQPGDQKNNILSGEDLQRQQNKALSNGDKYFLIPVTPSNYFPLAGSSLRELLPNDLDTSPDSKSAPIPVDTDISGFPSPISPGPPGMRKQTEKLRRS